MMGIHPLIVLSPYFLGNLLHMVYLSPLLRFSELVAYLAGSESALRAETQSVEWYILLCLVDAAYHLFLVFQYRRFGRYLSEYDLLVFRNILQRFETAGALVVVFQIDGIDVFLGKHIGGYRVIGTLAGP